MVAVLCLVAAQVVMSASPTPEWKKNLKFTNNFILEDMIKEHLFTAHAKTRSLKIRNSCRSIKQICVQAIKWNIRLFQVGVVWPICTPSDYRLET